jgi:twinkle protein
MTEYSKESQKLVSKGPCNDCGSSDACALYEDGHTYCYSCEVRREGEVMPITTVKHTPLLPNLENTKIGPILERNINADTLRSYDVRLKVEEGVVVSHYYPYTDKEGNTIAYKIRDVPKNMYSKGNINKATLFGQSKFNGGGKYVTVTEGEIDCLSVYQMMGSRYPVVSIKNGAQAAYRDVKRNFEWLNSFENIVLAFDSDDPGIEACHSVASLFPKKVHVMNLQRKDAGEYLENNDGKEFVNLWWRATEEAYQPEDIITGERMWDAIMKEDTFTSYDYPWAALNDKTYGMRTSEMTIVTAGAGVGKTSFVKETAYYLLNNYDAKVGLIMLEETKQETGKGLISLALDKPVHLPDTHVTDLEMRSGHDATWGTERIVSMDTRWASNNIEYISDKIAYLVQGCDCKSIFLDHISFMVSDNNSDERKMLDEIAHKLKAQCVALDYNLVAVIHTKRQTGKPLEEGGKASLSDIRGTAGVGQLANIALGLERDGQNGDPKIRNTTHVRVLKNRFSGKTGPSSYLLYNEFTGRLIETEVEEDSDD